MRQTQSHSQRFPHSGADPQSFCQANIARSCTSTCRSAALLAGRMRAGAQRSRTSLIHTRWGFTHRHSTSHFPRSPCFLTEIYLTRLTQGFDMKDVFQVAMPHTASCWSPQGGRWRARAWETSPASPWGIPQLS